MVYHLDRRTEDFGTISDLKNTDICIGIPTLNNENGIQYVVETVAQGLAEYFPGTSSVIVISDGNSTDNTRKLFKETQIPDSVKKIDSIYPGKSGKGNAIKNILQIADYLGTQACMIVDADLRSINKKWVKLLLGPVLDQKIDMVFPLYLRYKYDAIITKHFLYPITRALYGYEILQPIGGDVGFSRDALDIFLKEINWNTENAQRYGVDIWMTTLAIVKNLRKAQAALRVKIHDLKDPVEVTAPMFRQVIGSCFELAGRFQEHWLNVRDIKNLPQYGSMSQQEPEPIQVMYDAIPDKLQESFESNRHIWEWCLPAEQVKYIEKIKKDYDEQQLYIKGTDWACLIYDFLLAYTRYSGMKDRIIDAMTPLYYLILADFLNKSMEKTTRQSIQLVFEEADDFFNKKDYLVDKWKNSFQLSEV